MDFLELAKLRQSCRAYDETREVEPEKLQAILEATLNLCGFCLACRRLQFLFLFLAF